MEQGTKESIWGFLIWFAVVVMFGGIVVLVGECDAEKNSDPPPQPPASVDTLYLQPIVIDRFNQTTIIKFFTCLRDTHPEATGNLVCLDENGDVILP
jgi:hypothetical protein